MIPVISVSAMRLSDRRTIDSGTPGIELMYRAGEAIFSACPWRGKTAVVCGSGNNGGDGFVLALLLKRAGRSVRLFLMSDTFSPDAEYYFNMCRDENVEYERYGPDSVLEGYDNIADCIFGTGFHGCARGEAADAIESINRSGAFVVSADINSGLGGDSGMGKPCVKSDLTVSIGCFKPGHFLNTAKDNIKAAVNADIGIEPAGRTYMLCQDGDFGDILKKRPNFSSKGDFGYVALVGGSDEYSGAVKLANMSCAALRAGCGVAKLVVPRTAAHGVMPYILESTLCPVDDDGSGHIAYNPAQLDAAIRRMAAVSVGMGWGRGRDNERVLRHIMEGCNCPVIIDADGLNTLAGTDMSMLRGKKTVLTPHLAEFERISGLTKEEILSSPIDAAEDFARANGVILLLKGTATVVTDGSETYIVNRGCPGMATAGSGDVLSGILTGLLGWCPFSALTVACGAYIAGLSAEYAAEETGDISMLSSDTVRHIARAVRHLTL